MIRSRRLYEGSSLDYYAAFLLQSPHCRPQSAMRFIASAYGALSRHDHCYVVYDPLRDTFGPNHRARLSLKRLGPLGPAVWLAPAGQQRFSTLAEIP